MKPLVLSLALAVSAVALPPVAARALPVPMAPAQAPAVAVEEAQLEAQGKAQQETQKKAQPLELWNGLRLGMSQADVRARHPSPTIFLGGSCRALLKPIYRLGKLEAVRIGQYLDHNDCGREIYAGLLRKYGVPTGQNRVGYVDLSGFGDSYDFYWYHSGRAIKLRLLANGRFNELSYAPDPAGGAIGLSSKL